MTRIFLSLVFLFFSSAAALTQEEPPEFAVPALITSPLPVDLAIPEAFHESIVGLNGRLELFFADISIAARGWPLTLGHRYSPGATDTGLGPDWVWSFATLVTRENDTGTLVFQENDGDQNIYAQIGPGRYQTVAGRLDSRVYPTKSEGLVRLYADGSQEFFDQNMRLIRREGRNGFGYDLIYDGAGIVEMRHDDGQFFKVNWQAGRVDSVVDMLNRRMGFRYDDGKLAGTTDSLNRETRFEYSDTGQLSVAEFADASTLEISYDANLLVSRLLGPGSLETRFGQWGSINDGRIVQTRIDAAGGRFRTELTLDPVMADQFLVVETGPDGVQIVRDQRDGQIDVAINGRWIGATVMDSSGDPALLITQSGTVPLPLGGQDVISLAFPDERGNPQLVTMADAAYWQKPDAAGRVIALAGETGRVEDFTYDAGDRLIRHLDAAGVGIDYKYDAADRPIEWRASDGRWMSYAYNEEGLVAKVSGSETPTISYTYDQIGRIETISDGTLDLRASFDAAGFVAALLDEQEKGIRFNRDDAGRVIEIIDDLGFSGRIEMDAGLTVTSETGQVRGLAEDWEGREVIVGFGGEYTFTEPLDSGETLATTILPDGQGRVERFDASGVLVAAESLSDRPIVIETDEAGRVVLAGDPLMPSAVTYDENGLVSEVTDSIGVPTVYQHDENGRMISAASPYLGIELTYDGDADTPSGMRTSERQTFTQDVSDDGRLIRYSGTDRTGLFREETVQLDEQGRVIRQEAEGAITEIGYPDENTVEISVTETGRTLQWREVTCHIPLGSMAVS